MPETWARVLEDLQEQLNPLTFDTWLKPTYQIGRDGDQLKVWVPNRLFAEWIGDNFHPMIERALTALGWSGIRIHYVTGDHDTEASAGNGNGDGSQQPSGLNPRYTF